MGKDNIKQSSKKMVALRMSIGQHVPPGFEDKSDHPHFINARQVLAIT
jgi:hypothetical protein